MRQFTLILLFFVACNPKEEIIHPKAIAITVIGDVSSNGKKIKLAQEITDQDLIVVGQNSVCDLQLLESDSLVVLRLKSASKFQLTGKKIGNKKENFFTILAGTAIFNVTKLGEEEGISTKTPTVTAGVRGTKYEVKVQSDGSTNISVLEGTVSTQPRIPEIDKFSKKEIKSNKVLKTITNTLEEKTFEIKAGEASLVSSESNKKILSKAGLSETIKNPDIQTIGKDTNINELKDTLGDMENNELQFSKSQIDPKVMNQKLKEYNDLTPFDKDKINDKQARNQWIQVRFKRIESSWWDDIKKWFKGLKI